MDGNASLVNVQKDNQSRLILWKITTSTRQIGLPDVLVERRNRLKSAADTTGVSQKTIVQLYQYMRYVCSTKLLNTPPDLGGPGVVVQIDESLFNHKSKYQRGRRPDKETWVFGIADTSTKPAVTYMQTVAKRDAATLLPIIQKVVRPGSIVYSDEWRAYLQIQPKLGQQHETVNHSVNFVDTSTGVHTQSIESYRYWAKTKYKYKIMKGVRSDALPSYLDERMWRDRWGTTTKDAFYNLCRHISEQYPF
jgi:transposase-like protein